MKTDERGVNMNFKRKLLKILCTSAVSMLLPSINTAAYAQDLLKTSDSLPNITLTATANPSENCVDLNWKTSDAGKYSYRIYQKKHR